MSSFVYSKLLLKNPVHNKPIAIIKKTTDMRLQQQVFFLVGLIKKILKNYYIQYSWSLPHHHKDDLPIQVFNTLQTLSTEEVMAEPRKI